LNSLLVGLRETESDYPSKSNSIYDPAAAHASVDFPARVFPMRMTPFSFLLLRKVSAFWKRSA